MLSCQPAGMTGDTLDSQTPGMADEQPDGWTATQPAGKTANRTSDWPDDIPLARVAIGVLMVGDDHRNCKHEGRGW